MKNHWLVKSEPSSYSWEDFVREKDTAWTGVRNFQARIHLRAMRVGDEVLFYHSVTDKAVVGRAKVSGVARVDPTATDGEWVCVDLVPVKALKRPVTLEEIKADPTLKNMTLLKQSRLSVTSLTAEEFRRIVELGS